MKTFELNELAFKGKISLSHQYAQSDTVIIQNASYSDIGEGVAVYQLGNDSTAIQVFYKINAPWYKPWKKFALMLNESKYGPSLDSAINRISRQF